MNPVTVIQPAIPWMGSFLYFLLLLFSGKCAAWLKSKGYVNVFSTANMASTKELVEKAKKK